MNYAYFQIGIVVFLLLLYSRHILNLSLSLLVTSSSLVFSLIGIAVSIILFCIAAVPVGYIGCTLAERHYENEQPPRVYYTICGKSVKKPVVIQLKRVDEFQHVRPTSAPGKY